MGRGSLELVVFAGDSPHTGKLKERGLVTRLTSGWMRLDSGGGARRIHLQDSRPGSVHGRPFAASISRRQRSEGQDYRPHSIAEFRDVVLYVRQCLSKVSRSTELWSGVRRIAAAFEGLRWGGLDRYAKPVGEGKRAKDHEG